ncbi:MAG: 16S rRNA (uracil(1498)-N(3))-methyltransferase, partial [Alphaproteobacteria bacterium]|nr:16S rRNA (uracil(1498)-N(3))-methyltransferase [Alphaproteobacteria bacterium]
MSVCALASSLMAGSVAAMPDSIKVRIFVDAPLTLGAEIALDRSRSHYLGHVMRKGVGDILALFNGRDGEWRARVTSTGKGGLRLEVDRRIKAQMAGADLWLIFAPIKRQRI